MRKACFQHGMAYGDFKDLNRRTAAVKYYMIKHLMLLKIQNMIDINVDSRARLKVELDLSDNAAKANLKNPSGLDTSPFAKKMIKPI